GGCFRAPAIDEILHATSEADAAVRIANFQGWARDALAFSHEEFEFAIGGLSNAQNGHRAKFHACFDANAEAALAVVKSESAQHRAAFGDSQMKWSIMAHEQEVLLEIHRVKLSIASPATEQVHDLHCLAILQIPFAAARNPPRSQQRTTQN